MKKYITKRILFYICVILVATFLFFTMAKITPRDPITIILAKPVIYLYPEETTQVDVDVAVQNGRIFVTYPEKGDGWHVAAHPDGTITDENGVNHNYLFWEAKSDFTPDLSSGFVVKGSETAAFLQQKLSYLGLSQNEINEFLVYWLPLMVENEYNLISFQWDNYDDFAPLTISPQPDSILRVYMATKPLDTPIEIPEQTLPTFSRTGFSVIEWGGMQVK